MSIVAVIVCLFNLLDAFSTLYILRHGGVELNPLMGFLINHGGPSAFVAAKVVVVGTSVVVLAVHGRHPLARMGLWLYLAFYLLLTAWHGWCIFSIYLVERSM